MSHESWLVKITIEAKYDSFRNKNGIFAAIYDHLYGYLYGEDFDITHGMLVLGCCPAVVDFSSPGGRRLVVLSGVTGLSSPVTIIFLKESSTRNRDARSCLIFSSDSIR